MSSLCAPLPSIDRKRTLFLDVRGAKSPYGCVFSSVSLAGALSLEEREYWSTSQSLNYYYPSYRSYRRHLWEYSASILSGLVCRWHFGHFDGILVIFPFFF